MLASVFVEECRANRSLAHAINALVFLHVLVIDVIVTHWYHSVMLNIAAFICFLERAFPISIVLILFIGLSGGNGLILPDHHWTIYFRFIV